MAETRDGIDVLLDDHRLLDGLLERLDREERPAEMRMLFFRIAHELAAHEAAEHDVVFPAARAALPSPGHALLNLAAEHDEANSLLKEMVELDPARLSFDKRASALVLELRAHFAAEEELLFPQLRAALTPAALAQLAEDVRSAKRAAPVFPKGG